MTGGEQTGRRTKWLIALAVVAAAGLAFLVARGIGRLAGSGFGSARGGMLAVSLQAAAKQIRDQAPIKVDTVTTLTGAMAMEDTIIYTLTLDVDVPTDQIAVIQAKQEAIDRSRACADADIRKLIEAGGKMRWLYTDRSGEQFQANLAKCG